ncbi:hypothetical protein [Paractinoplanes maris]|uniref:hypothetical protein n=1 Tax=Paractinoplanes maris TaxID=1734446 RepID=UPI002021705A|nr:hypothetical protein [Actinoplanes maris]
MTELWPRIPLVVAAALHADLKAGKVPVRATTHPDQLWAPVGGRVSSRQIQLFVESIVEVALAHGFPGAANAEARVAFDRAAAPVVRHHMDLSWADGGSRELWSFTSLVALPDVTMWRFGVENKERWIASDLTRHMWARLWWQAVVFAGRDHVLAALSESDLNQLLERRIIGGDPRLATALAVAVVAAPPDVNHRLLIREVTKMAAALPGIRRCPSVERHAVGRVVQTALH